MLPVGTDFSTWLNGELQQRGWSQSELARRGGVTPASISRIASGERKPGLEVCRAISAAFGISVTDVMRRAGIEPDIAADSEEARQLLYDFAQLPAADRKAIKDQVRALKQLREQQANYGTTGTNK